jgi:hypothetical protein
MNPRVCWPRCLAALLLLALVGCSRAPKDPVERLLHDLTRASEERDAPGVGARLDEEFKGDGEMTKADAVAMVRRYFAAYDRVEVAILDVQRTDASRIAFRVDFSGKPKDIGGLAGLLPSAAAYAFELELAGAGNALKVRRAAWRPLAPRSSP